MQIAMVDAVERINFSRKRRRPEKLRAVSGRPTAARKDQQLRPLHIQKETPNKYGEAIKKIIGVCFNALETVVTRFREWIISPIDFAKELKNEVGFFAFEGANAPPWSSVNNCRER